MILKLTKLRTLINLLVKSQRYEIEEHFGVE